MRPSTIDILGEFLDTVDTVYGLYLDSVTAYRWEKERFLSTQQDALRYFLQRGDRMELDDLDAKLMHIGKGDPNKENPKFLHRCTQGEYKARNAEGGLNHVMISNLCLVLIYQYWEDHYRQKLASDLDVDVSENQIDILGDIRLLRNSIIHHRAVALSDVEKCKIITQFQEGDRIALSEEAFEEIILHVKMGMIELAEGDEGGLAEAFERHRNWPY